MSFKLPVGCIIHLRSINDLSIGPKVRSCLAELKGCVSSSFLALDWDGVPSSYDAVS